jgi:hypothetical protein
LETYKAISQNGASKQNIKLPGDLESDDELVNDGHFVPAEKTYICIRTTKNKSLK